MAIKATPQQFADRWVQNIGASTQKMSENVDSLTVSPTSQAAKAQAKMLANLTAKVNDGTWAASLNKVSLDQWRTAFKTKGIPRVAQGAQAASQKMIDFAAQLLPYEATLQAKVQGMNNLTKADAKARMNAWFDGMSTFKKK